MAEPKPGPGPGEGNDGVNVNVLLRCRCGVRVGSRFAQGNRVLNADFHACVQASERQGNR